MGDLNLKRKTVLVRVKLDYENETFRTTETDIEHGTRLEDAIKFFTPAEFADLKVDLENVNDLTLAFYLKEYIAKPFNGKIRYIMTGKTPICHIGRFYKLDDLKKSEIDDAVFNDGIYGNLYNIGLVNGYDGIVDYVDGICGPVEKDDIVMTKRQILDKIYSASRERLLNVINKNKEEIRILG
ncbi:MAG: hypothetical protein IJ529_03950 [Alphaproteobacteria bacterium]|nr:hypothetical protein [Alphaproteobacteria bacterium]MBR1943463.1 hypothetical protein [bacterium]